MSHSGFHEKSIEDKRNTVKYLSDLDDKDLDLLEETDLKNLEKTSENVIGAYDLPFSVATNFLVNGEDYIVPMSTEEKSVVAAASNGAKMCKGGGGFEAETDYYMKGQLLGTNEGSEIQTFGETYMKIKENEEELLDIMNSQSSYTKAKDISVKRIERHKKRPLFVLEARIKTSNSMGANTINKMMESIEENVEDITGGKAYLGVLRNLPEGYTEVKTKIPIKNLEYNGVPGKEVASDIEMASFFAENDFQRAVTHNKGIMNGIDSLAIATGNDFRALEAAAHGYASKNGKYKPLSTWSLENESLVGELEMPITMGTVGGAISSHPKSQLALKILDVDSSEELCNVAGSLGLAQNLAALRALSMEGITYSHEKLKDLNE